MDLRVIGIDWSGAKRGARRKVWLAEFRSGEPGHLITGKTRDWIRDFLISSCREFPNTVIGIDFAFSLPAWFVKQQGWSTVDQLWMYAQSCGEDWLSQCHPPFWGRTGKLRPDLSDGQLFRKTEIEVGNIAGISPKSTFQINGPGTVGTGSIRGMCLLHQLNQAGFSIWPFHASAWPRMVELWPRLLTGKVNKSDFVARAQYVADNWPGLPEAWVMASEESDDAFDAIVSACVMNKYRDQLASLEPAVDPTTLLEGSIWRPV